MEIQCFAECHLCSVTIKSIMLSVVILNVVAPIKYLGWGNAYILVVLPKVSKARRLSRSTKKAGIETMFEKQKTSLDLIKRNALTFLSEPSLKKLVPEIILCK